LVVLPELWAHGGFAYPSWSARAEALDGRVVSSLSAAAREIGAAIHLGSIVERTPRGLWDTAVLLNPQGDVTPVYHQIHRFGFGEGEPDLMEAGTELVTAALAGPGGVGSATAGLATCYDLRFPELFRRLLDAGSEMFLVPAAWPAARVDHWTLLGRA